MDVKRPINDGYTHESLTWTQTQQELTFNIAIPDDAQQLLRDNGKLAVTTTKTTLSCLVKGHDPFFTGEFPFPIAPSESIWTIEGNASIELSMEKEQDQYWRSPLVGYPNIDLSLVEWSRQIEADEDDGDFRPVQITDKDMLKKLQEENPDFKLVKD